MTRDELRASLEAKGIIMPNWPTISPSQRLVVDQWGCADDVIDIPPDTDSDTANMDAIIEWAERIETNGGWSGKEYPHGDTVYVIDHVGHACKMALYTDFTPSFAAEEAGHD